MVPYEQRRLGMLTGAGTNATWYHQGTMTKKPIGFCRRISREEHVRITDFATERYRLQAIRIGSPSKDARAERLSSRRFNQYFSHSPLPTADPTYTSRKALALRAGRLGGGSARIFGSVQGGQTVRAAACGAQREPNCCP